MNHDKTHIDYSKRQISDSGLLKIEKKKHTHRSKRELYTNLYAFREMFKCRDPLFGELSRYSNVAGSRRELSRNEQIKKQNKNSAASKVVKEVLPWKK